MSDCAKHLVYCFQHAMKSSCLLWFNIDSVYLIIHGYLSEYSKLLGT